MKAEDLYKAMEGIDDELILRSEHRIETAREEEEEAERRKATAVVETIKRKKK